MQLTDRIGKALAVHRSDLKGIAMEPKDRIIHALDYPMLADAFWAAMNIREHVSPIKKVGPGLQLRSPEIIKTLQSHKFRVFYDGKFDDTPETVAAASEAMAVLGISMFTIHCDGGDAMMKAAKETVDGAMNLPYVKQEGFPRPSILGVLMLTSKSSGDLVQDGLINLNPDAPAKAYEEMFEEVVMRRALRAEEIGLDGVVVSPRFVKYVRRVVRPGFIIVTPGIHMVKTAGQAIRDGADYIVVGRLFRQTDRPIEVAHELAEVIAAALDEREEWKRESRQ